MGGLIGTHVSETVFFLFKIGESMLEPSVRLYLYEVRIVDVGVVDVVLYEVGVV